MGEIYRDKGEETGDTGENYENVVGAWPIERGYERGGGATRASRLVGSGGRRYTVGAMATKRLKHTLHAVIYRSDADRVWYAHCLELDILTHGGTQEEAVEMITDAIETMAQSNVRAGLPPLAFRSAPPEDWARLDGAEDIATRVLNIDAAPFSEEITLEPTIARAS